MTIENIVGNGAKLMLHFPQFFQSISNLVLSFLLDNLPIQHKLSLWTSFSNSSTVAGLHIRHILKLPKTSFLHQTMSDFLHQTMSWLFFGIVMKKSILMNDHIIGFSEEIQKFCQNCLNSFTHAYLEPWCTQWYVSTIKMFFFPWWVVQSPLLNATQNWKVKV